MPRPPEDPVDRTSSSRWWLPSAGQEVARGGAVRMTKEEERDGRCLRLVASVLLMASLASAAMAAPPPVGTGGEDDRAAALEAELEARVEEMARRLEERARQAEVRAEERARETERRAERRHRSGGGTRVTMGGRIHVAEGETSSDVVAIGGGVTVDGAVLGDAVAIGGAVDVRGRVTGDVVSVGRGVYLGPEAEVLGEVVSVGGRIHRDEGARVSGEITEVSFAGGFFGPLLSRSFDWEWRWDRRGYFRGSVTRVLGNLTRLLVVAVLGALVILVAPGPVQRAAARIERQPLAAGMLGLTLLCLYLPLLVAITGALAISIIGIPLILLVLFTIPVFAAMVFFGYVTSAYSIGRWTERRFGWTLGGAVAAFLVGLLFLRSWSLVSDLINVADGPHNPLIFLVMLFAGVGVLLLLVACSVGLGGIVLGWGEGRARAEAPAPVSPPPPGPPTPSVVEPSPQSPPEHGPAVRHEAAPATAGEALDDAEPAPGKGAQDEPAVGPKGGEKGRRRKGGETSPGSWEEPWPEEEEERWPRAEPDEERRT